MDFSSLVLMEREKGTNYLIREMGSYEVGEGGKYIRKMFFDGKDVNIYFDTEKDVEEWEYSAIYDLFNEVPFSLEGFLIESVEDEYNPTWFTKFPFNEEYSIVQEKLRNLCIIIDEEIAKVFEAIKNKEEEYK